MLVYQFIRINLCVFSLVALQRLYATSQLMSLELVLQVIKANDDLTSAHYTYFMYQLIAGLAHIHSGLFEMFAQSLIHWHVCRWIQ